MSGLADAFLAGCPIEGVDRAALEDVLAAHVAAATTAWSFGIAAEDFVAHLAARDAEWTLATLTSARAADVYLALACARGDERAIAAFERTYFDEIDRAARKTRAGDDLANDVRGKLRRILFVSEETRRAAVADYGGRGDLRGWLRVIAMREMIHAIKRAGRDVPTGDQSLFDILSPGADPELAYLRDLYREQFEAAFRVALGALTSRQRSLLRYQLVDGLNVDEVGALHGVHRATAARWIADARESIAERTRTELAERLGATSLEVESIIRLVRSRIDVSLERVIRMP